MPQNHTSQNTTSTRCLTAIEREQIAIQVRRAGNTYDQIAARIGVSRQAAHKMIKKVLGRLNQQTSERGRGGEAISEALTEACYRGKR